MVKLNNTKITHNQENKYSLSKISEWKEKNNSKILSYNDYINKIGVFSNGIRTF